MADISIFLRDGEDMTIEPQFMKKYDLQVIISMNLGRDHVTIFCKSAPSPLIFTEAAQRLAAMIADSPATERRT